MEFVYFVLFLQSEVTLDDIFSFLMHFRADESLCRGTELWDQVRCTTDTHEGRVKADGAQVTNCYLTYLWQLCAWLMEHEGSFKSRIMDGNCTDASKKKETIRAYVEGEMLAYLWVPASTGESGVTSS